MEEFIYQRKDWPNFFWDNNEIITLLSEARNLQGRLLGKMESIGFELRDEALLETMTLEVLKSAEIEGEVFNPESVRSSIAQRLGITFAGIPMNERNVDGMVEMVIDASKTPLVEAGGLTHGSVKLRHALWARMRLNVIGIADSQFSGCATDADRAAMLGSVIGEFASEKSCRLVAYFQKNIARTRGGLATEIKKGCF
jgi:hypothetical protein